MGNVPRGRRRCKASQTSFDSSAIASSDSDFNSKELDSSDGLDSRDDEDEEEDEEEEEEEEYLTLGYPQEDFNLGRDSDAYKPRSP